MKSFYTREEDVRVRGGFGPIKTGHSVIKINVFGQRAQT